MSDQELRDKLASEWWHQFQTGIPVTIHAVSIFKAGWDAARANPIPVGAIIDVDQDALIAERDQLRAEVERLSAENKHLRTNVLNPLIVNDMDENIRLKAQCEKLAEALGRASGYMDSLAFYTGEMADKYLQEKSADIKQVLAEYRKGSK